MIREFKFSRKNVMEQLVATSDSSLICALLLCFHNNCECSAMVVTT